MEEEKEEEEFILKLKRGVEGFIRRTSLSTRLGDKGARSTLSVSGVAGRKIALRNRQDLIGITVVDLFCGVCDRPGYFDVQTKISHQKSSSHHGNRPHWEWGSTRTSATLTARECVNPMGASV